MQSARLTAAALMAWRMAGICEASSGKLRWQCESVNIAGGAGAQSSRLDCLGWAIRGQIGTQDLFDFLTQCE